VGEKVRTSIETGPLLETVAGRIADSLHVRQVAVMLDGGGPYRPAYSIGYGEGLHVMFSGSTAVVRRLEKEKEPSRIYFGDPESWIYRDPEMTDEQRMGLAELDSELLIPLSVKDKLIGFMSLGQKSSEEPYSGNDLRLLKSVAAQVGMALEVASLTASIGQEIAQRERVNRELEIAREVQERLFPQALPAVPGLDYCGRCQPAREVGGDYYDFLDLPGKKLGVAVGDVSGKGIGAALMMAGLQASLRAQTSIAVHNLADLMSKVNRLVYEVSSENRYATFFYAQYDPGSHQLTYVNAGHNPPLVLRESDSGWCVMHLDVGGAVVGLLQQAPYTQGAFTLEFGDLVVAFTDGVSEAMNVEDEEWGEENLIGVAKTCAGLSAAESVCRIMTAAHAFTAGAPQHDDMTLVVLHVLSSSAVPPESRASA
jgi:phosphoserine phosphatase RsbU/P